MRKIEVLEPVGEVSSGELKMMDRPRDLEGKVIGFMWNHKPNGDLLLKNVREALKEKSPLSTTLSMKEKALASSGAPPEILEELSAKCDLVVLAIGDCGSCVSWLIYDAVELEKRGTPTLSICTDEFAPLGRMEAQALQLPRLPMAVIPHPLGGLKPTEVAEKAKIAFQEIMKILFES